jgi:hypothetical protein
LDLCLSGFSSAGSPGRSSPVRAAQSNALLARSNSTAPLRKCFTLARN